jgi:hypothetical protein
MTYISPERREKSATVRAGKKKKFPVDSVQTAKSALHLINNAKPPLDSKQRANVIKRAHEYAPNIEAPPPKGSSKKSATRKKK